MRRGRNIPKEQDLAKQHAYVRKHARESGESEERHDSAENETQRVPTPTGILWCPSKSPQRGRGEEEPRCGDRVHWNHPGQRMDQNTYMKYPAEHDGTPAKDNE